MSNTKANMTGIQENEINITKKNSGYPTNKYG